jgi:hypothetical protein
MVSFVYNGYGYLYGHRFTFGWANDTGASINFDEFGWVTFNSSGYGENNRVKIQLSSEYGRYFCSTAVCYGFSNWITSLVSYFTIIQWFGNVDILVKDFVTGLPISGMKVCVGLMCNSTGGDGKVHVGQFANGMYSLASAGNGYENYVESIVVNGDYSKTIFMTPTGVIPPNSPCSSFPSYLVGMCTWVTTAIQNAIQVITQTVITPLLNAVSAIQTNTSVLTQNVTQISGDILKNAVATASSIQNIYTDLYNTYSIITDEYLIAVAAAVKKTTEDMLTLDKNIRSIIPSIVEGAFVSIMERVLEQEVKR